MIEHDLDHAGGREGQRLQHGLTLAVELRASASEHVLRVLVLLLPLGRCELVLAPAQVVGVAEMDAIASVTGITRPLGTSPFHGFKWAKFACLCSLDALAALPPERLRHPPPIINPIKLNMQLTFRLHLSVVLLEAEPAIPYLILFLMIIWHPMWCAVVAIKIMHFIERH